MKRRTIETLTITRVVEEDTFPTTVDTTAEPASERRVRIYKANALPAPYQALERWVGDER